MGTRPTSLPRDLGSLTAVRAAAALLVFVFHLHAADLIQFDGARLGYTGVGFFFMLSGFLLTWGYSPDLDRRRFYLRRFARVYPNHLVTWAIALLLPATVLVSWLAVALNLVLLQAWAADIDIAYAVNGVAWSLSCEAAFYAAFPFLLAFLHARHERTRWLMAGAAFLAASVFVVLATRGPIEEPLQAWRYVNPLVRAPEFVLGMVAALSVKAGRSPWWWLPVPAVAVAAAGLAFFPERPAADVWLGLVFLSVIVVLARLDSEGRWGLVRSRPLVYLGKVSFAFYLVHQLVVSNLAAVPGDRLVVAAGCLVVSFLAAVGLYHAVELPAQRRIVAIAGARRKTPRSDPMPT